VHLVDRPADLGCCRAAHRPARAVDSAVIESGKFRHREVSDGSRDPSRKSIILPDNRLPSRYLISAVRFIFPGPSFDTQDPLGLTSPRSLTSVSLGSALSLRCPFVPDWLSGPPRQRRSGVRFFSASAIVTSSGLRSLHDGHEVLQPQAPGGLGRNMLQLHRELPPERMPTCPFDRSFASYASLPPVAHQVTDTGYDGPPRGTAIHPRLPAVPSRLYCNSFTTREAVSVS
jgi:hypothetical protein